MRNKILKQVSLICIFCCMVIISWAQMIVKGTVRSANGEAVSGASILQKGQKKGTSSNADGSFTLSGISAGAMLEISYIGFETTNIAAAATVDAVLVPKANQLADVEIVVDKGYGKTKRNAVTSVISSVKGSDLAGMPNTNLGSVLQGRASGVQISNSGGANPPTQKILIRGFTSLQNSTDPLVIMDGINLGRSGLNFVNLADIENIDILKDASGAAIYGSDASGGVIIITTKKGKLGRFQTDADVSYGSAFYKDPKMADAEEYMAVQKRRNPAYVPPTNAANTNWWKESVKSANQINANISFSGGTEKLNSFASLGYTKSDGNYTVGGAYWQKVLARVNFDFTPNKYLKVGFNLNPRFENWVNAGQGDLMPVMRTEPTLPVFVSRPDYNQFSQFSQTGIDRNSNPIAALSRGIYNKNYAVGIIGATYLDITLIKNLHVRSQMNINTGQGYSAGYTPRYYNGNLDRNFDPTDPSSLNKSDNAYNNSNHTFNWIWTQTANYSYRLKDAHSFNLLAGYESRKEYSLGNSASRFKSQDPTNPDYYYLNFMQGDFISTGGYESQDTWGAIFGRLNYNYKEKYFIEGNARRDASSRFYNDNKYALFPSGSIGWIVTKEKFLSPLKQLNYLKLRAGYGEIGNSSLNDPASYLNFLSPSFNSVNTVNFGNPRVGSPIYVVARPSNPKLKWERDIDQNIGFDSYWFESRLYVNAELYKRKAKDLLFTDYVGREELGIPGGQKLNLGQISNKGWEATVGFKSKQSNQLKYDLSANFSHNTPYLDSYGLTGEPVLGNAQGYYRLTEELQGPYTKSEVGQEIGRYWGYQKVKVFQNQTEINAYTDKSGNLIQPNAKPGDFKYQDTNGDGVIDDKDRVYMGSRNPKLEVGLNIRIEYKGFDFAMSGYGRFGHNVMWFAKKFNYQGALGANIFAGASSKAWSGEGSTDANPAYVKDGASPDLLRFSSWFLEKGDYFRINNLQLGYTIPAQLIPKMRKLRVYVNAQNMITFTRYPGINPEIYNADLPINANGVDISQYPVKKTIIVGLSIGL